MRILLKLFIVVCTTYIVSSSTASAYTTPYFASRLDDLVSAGFQTAQVVAKNDTVYVSSYSGCSIHKIVNKSRSENVAGRQGYCGYTPDGRAGRDNLIQGSTSIDVADDGTIYFAEPYQHHVRAILPDGTLKTVAGNGISVNDIFLTDSPDATKTPFNTPSYVKIGPDNNLYIFDSGLIRRVLKDGSTDHVAGVFGGGQVTTPYVEGGIASQHFFSIDNFGNHNRPSWCLFDFDSKGNLYASSGVKIFKINKDDNTIHTYYTPPAMPTNSFEEKPLSEGSFGAYNGLEIDDEDQIWLADSGIYYVSPLDSIVRAATGGGTVLLPPLTGAAIPANTVKLGGIKSISVDKGNVYFINSYTSERGSYESYVGMLSKRRDLSPPTIKPRLDQTPDDNGWNSTPVTLSWDITDSETPVTTTSGCEPTYITATSGRTFTCSATSEGGTSSQSITVKVDTTKPIITPRLSPAPNSDGWYTATASLSWEVNDPDSPITNKSGCESVTQATDSVNTTYTCVALSGGGLMSQSISLKRDTTPPSLSSPSLTNGFNLSLFHLGYLFLLTNSTALSATTTDDSSGSKVAEYFIDKDPGVGKAKTIPVVNGQVTGTVGLSGIGGQHTLYIRAQDNAGNWSLPKSVSFTRLGL